jgi:hypothetical protein
MQKHDGRSLNLDAGAVGPRAPADVLLDAPDLQVAGFRWIVIRAGSGLLRSGRPAGNIKLCRLLPDLPYFRCWARCLFISNIVTFFAPNTASSFSSARISRRSSGFCS